MKLIDLTNKTFGRLTVMSRAPSRKGCTVWRCKCECGNETESFSANLTRGTSTSCGCLAAELAGARVRTHGMTKTRPFKTWSAMMERCYTESHNVYENYGGRGITVCERWHKFENFWEDMKDSYASDLTLDRIDNNAGYSPENCRWATALVQSNNKRNNKFIEHAGKRLTLAQWAREIGIKVQTVKSRFRKGWPPERILAA